VLAKLPGVLLILAILGVWQVTVTTGVLASPSIPAVSDIIRAWATSLQAGEMLGELLPTLRRLAIGYGLAVALAVPIGALMGSSRFFFNLLEPLTEIVRPIPSAAYVPIAILLLGIGDSMKISVVAVACFFPILLNTYSGVRGCDPILIDTGRTFGFGPWSRLRKIVLPTASPDILTGMRISLGIGLIVTIVSEMLAGNDGIGYLILDSQRIFLVSKMFAAIFMLGVVGYLLNFLFVRVENYVLRWRTDHG
jgi:ABC-type nitrate/sulfonate/bicarbonate transport system permease component